MGKRFDAILLDVDGTLLDFNQSEALGIKKLLEHYGLEPRQEYLDAGYQAIIDERLAAYEAGQTTKLAE